MGFPENKKLAKDINAVNTECTDRLGALMTQMSGRMDTANRILEGIASEETRTVYKPSVAVENEVLPSQVRTLRAYSPSSYSVLEEENFICPNVFEAAYNGEVTFYISYEVTESSVSSYAGGQYTVKQIYPFEVQVLKGNIPYEKGSGHDFVNFAVVEGAIYQIEFYLSAQAGGGAGSSASVTARASIRAVEETIIGTKTQYYYPAEGAPKIVDVDGELTVLPTTSSEESIYLFTPEIDGAVQIDFDVLSISLGQYAHASFVIRDSSGSQRLGDVANTGHCGPWSFTVLAGEQYSLIVSCGQNNTVTIGNLSLSAVKTTALPLKVPFVPVNEPYQLVQFTSGIHTKQGYVVAKLPESIYKTQPHFLIAMYGDVYPGNKTGSAEMVLYDVLNGKQDYRMDYAVNDTDHVNREELTYLYYGTYYDRYFVYIATINTEVCVVVELTNEARQPIQKIAKDVGYISATLF